MNSESKWYAVLTHPRHEKKVLSFLRAREVTAYLPVYRKMQKWRNGLNTAVEFPLFPSYLFVRINWYDRLPILQAPGIAHFITFGGLPSEIPEFEIQRIRSGLVQLNAEPYPYIKVGDVVTVKSGPLAGLRGMLVSKKNQTRFVLLFDILMRAVSVEMDIANLEHVDILEQPTQASTTSMAVC